jgi:hypothetical protein
MRNSSEYGSKLLKLCRKLKRKSGDLTDGTHDDPIEEIVLGFLAGEVSETKAATVLNKIKKHFVDYNELRVYREIELTKLLGSGFPQPKQVAQNIVIVLQQIFDHSDTLQLQHLREGGKREARKFLDEIKGLNAYVSARVMLLCVDAHAFPVHPKMLVMLQDEGVVDPDADGANVQGFLERHVPAKNIRGHYLLLRHHADHYEPPARPKKVVAKKATKKTVKKVAKKTAKKKTAVKKKTAAKKVSEGK